MFESLRKNLGFVCGAKRDKTVPNTTGEKGSKDFEKKANPKNKHEMFNALYGDMRKDFEEIKDAGVNSYGQKDNDSSAAAGTGLCDDVSSGHTQEDIQMSWEERLNPESGASFFYNTITGECKGPGAPENGRLPGNKSAFKKVSQPPPPAMRSGTTLNTIQEPEVAETPSSTRFEGPSTARGGPPVLEQLSLNGHASVELRDAVDTKHTDDASLGAGGGMEHGHSTPKEEGKLETDDATHPNLDFFSAFASGAAGQDPSRARALITAQRLEKVSQSARDLEHKSALDSLFTVNDDAPPIDPSWNANQASGEHELSNGGLPGIDEETYSGPYNMPRSIYDDEDFRGRHGVAQEMIKTGKKTILIPPSENPRALPAATPVSHLRVAEPALPPMVTTSQAPPKGSPKALPKKTEGGAMTPLDMKKDIPFETALPPAAEPADKNKSNGVLAIAGSMRGIGVDEMADDKSLMQSDSFFERMSQPADLPGPEYESENEIVASLIKGIKTSVGYYYKNRSEESGGYLVLDEKKDYSSILKLMFNAEQAPFKAFNFKSYAGPVFENLRRMAGLKTEDYLRSLTGLGSYAEFHNKRRGWFYFTHDSCILVKTQTRQQIKKFREILPAYYKYVKQNPSTLLEPILGVYRMDYKGKSIYLTVCKNLFYTTLPLHERYKLKGVRSGRKATKKDKELYQGMLKDDDFKDRTLYLGGKRSKLVRQLERDTRFLASQKLISYHVLVGIHEAKHTVGGRNREEDDAELQLAMEEDEIFKHLELAQIKSLHPDGKEAEEIYFIGVTGLFQTYSGSRKMQHRITGVFKQKDDLSVVDHQYYQKRLMDFMKERLE